MARMGHYKRLAKKQGLTKRNVATVQTVKRMIGAHSETKTYDLSSGHAGGNTNTIAVLSNMAQGDAINKRQGDKISPMYLKYRLQNVVHANNTLGDVIRVVIFSDKQARGALPSAADVGLLDSPLGGLANIPSIDNYTSRFKIISDHIYNMNTENNNSIHRGSIKLKSPMKYGTAGDKYEDNALFVAIWSADNTNKASITINTRLFYKDT